MSQTLVLNSSYQAVNIVDHIKAIGYLYAGTAETLAEWDEEKKEYVRLEYDIEFANYNRKYVYKLPMVLRFVDNNKLPKRRKVIFNRHNLFFRDNYECCYCGKKFERDQELEIEHIVPKSRGGKDSFMNCVTACRACNSKKDDMTPQEAGMTLLKHPTEPDPVLIMKRKMMKKRNIPKVWYKYLVHNATIL